MTIIEELRYRSYAWNRKLTPDIAPERWSLAYGDTRAMEIRLQNEAVLRRGEGNPAVQEIDLKNSMEEE